MNARTWFGSFVGLVGLAALWLVYSPGTAEVAATSFTSSSQCRDCHAEVYREWEGSWHAQAWSDPDVRLLSNDFANTDCIACHASRPVFETGLDQRVLPRAARQSEGIDCIACHALPGPGGAETRMAGTLERLDVPCKPRATLELARPEFCAPCHDQHKTVEQWRATDYAAQGIDCLDCHMPFRGGDPNRGRDHTMLGAHDIELVRSAVELRAKRAADHVVVSVENVRAGHHFPTDERSRAADLFWRPVTDPPAPWRWLYRFRNPYRYELGQPDTLLPAHETRDVVLADPEAAGAIEVALFFKRRPYWDAPDRPEPEHEAELLHQLVLAP